MRMRDFIKMCLDTDLDAEVTVRNVNDPDPEDMDEAPAPVYVTGVVDLDEGFVGVYYAGPEPTSSDDDEGVDTPEL